MNVATHSSMVQYAYSDLLDCFKLHQIDSKCIKYITLFTSDKIAFKPRGQFLHLHKQTSKLQKKTYHGLPWLRTYRCQRLERKGKWSKGMRHYKTHSMAAGWGCKARRSQFFSVHSTHWCASAKVSVSAFSNYSCKLNAQVKENDKTRENKINARDLSSVAWDRSFCFWNLQERVPYSVPPMCFYMLRF